VIEENRLIAVGGINREADGCGRLRRFYVQPEFRRMGVGRGLAHHILRFAAEHYSRVVLRTDTMAADRFYVSLGFSRLAQDDGATHLLELKEEANREG
jgi:GNAT superfamily N-acetyltransferase